MKKLTFASLIAIGIIITLLFSLFTRLPDTYMGQKSPGIKAELFCPGLISTENNEHSSLIISSDGKKIFWAVSSLSIPNKQDIYFSLLTGNKWTTPKAIPDTISEYCGSPALSPNGEYLYYLQKDTSTEKNQIKPQIMRKIRITDNMSEGSEKTTSLIIPKINRLTMTFCFADNGNFYYDQGGPKKNKEWEFKIYKRIYKNGIYQSPVLLSNSINQGKFNWTPWVSRDEKTLIFASTRNSIGNLYICFQKSDKIWSNPVPLSAEINSPHPERFPSLSPDGKFFFFARVRKNQYTNSDFYWIKTEFLEKLKSKKLISMEK